MEKRKAKIICLLLLLCSNAFAQRIVEYRDLRTTTDENRGTVYYMKDGKRLLKGEYRILKGLDEECVHFSKGVMDGDYRRYRDGVLREAGTYAGGKRHGMFIVYYQDGKTPQKETPMQHGKIEGVVRTYFSDGKTDTEKEYRQSKQNGTERRFDPKTGKQVYEARFIDDKKEGEEWRISEDNEEGWFSKTVCHYKNGTLHGAYRYEAFLNGKPYGSAIGQYKDGYKEGHWKSFDARNGVTTEGEYAGGRETGHWKSYDATGEIIGEWDR